MSGGAHLTLHPERCDQCGRCMSACPVGAIKAGPSYIYVDWHACTRCNECVEACDRGALERSVVPARASASRPGVSLGDVSKVVVGSRAEAKAVRRAAEEAAKAKAKSGKAAEKPAAVAKPFVAAAGAGAPRSAVFRAPSKAPTSVSKAPVPPRAVAEGGPPPGSAAWSVADAAVVLSVLLLTVLAKDVVLGLAAVGLMPPAARTVVRAVVLAMYYSVQIGAFAWLASRHGAGLLAAFALRRDPTGANSPSDAVAAPAEAPSAIRSAGLVALAFVATEAFSIAYGLTMQKLGWVQPARLSSDLSALFGGGGVGVLLSVLLVALVAPFVEELAFRGVLLPVLGSRMSMWPAIVVSAVVYAAYHLNAWLFAPTLVLGIALGWLAWTRRSLWPAIALHVLYNAAAVAAGFYVTR